MEAAAALTEHASFREAPLGALTNLIADPAHHSGGGSVAAISASLSGALSVMIGSLSAQRRSNSAARDEILAIIDELNELIVDLQAGADTDSEVLVELMSAYRTRTTDERGYLESLDRAAKSTLALGDDIVRLLLLTERLVPYATRFTVSDLGGAAALAQGALIATLLTADVNIRLLSDTAGETDEIVEMARHLEALQTEGQGITERVTAHTRAALAGESR